MSMTLAERYKQETDWTARHILQDEIAMMGADAPLTETLEAKLERVATRANQ